LLGADGTIQIKLKLVRIPDIAFIAWDRFPERRLPKEAVPLVVPNLAVEVLSKSNTKREMAIKREEYFQAGVEMVWEVDPTSRTIDVHSSLHDTTTLTMNDTLLGGTVLRGFQLPLKDLFAELDRQG
jgi:Uma2 family endonuclease